MEEQSHRPGHIQLGAHRVHQRGEGGRGGVRKHTEDERCESWEAGERAIQWRTEQFSGYLP